MKKRKKQKGNYYLSNKYFDKYDREHNYQDCHESTPYIDPSYLAMKRKKEEQAKKRNAKIMIDNGLESKAELKVFQFLKSNHVKFNVRDPKFSVTNPKTGKQLTYAFSIPIAKVALEVGANELSTYQQYKDSLKRHYAKEQGYSELEISYKDIESSTEYIKILNSLVMTYQEKLRILNNN